MTGGADTDFLESMYSALQQPLGVAVTVSNRDSCLSYFYQVRFKAQDPALDGLIFVRSPLAKDEIWIIRAEVLKKMKEERKQKISLDHLQL